MRAIWRRPVATQKQWLGATIAQATAPTASRLSFFVNANARNARLPGPSSLGPSFRIRGSLNQDLTDSFPIHDTVLQTAKREQVSPRTQTDRPSTLRAGRENGTIQPRTPWHIGSNKIEEQRSCMKAGRHARSRGPLNNQVWRLARRAPPITPPRRGRCRLHNTNKHCNRSSGKSQTNKQAVSRRTDVIER